MLPLIAGAFLVNTVVAGAWTIAVFSILERRPKLSVPFGIGTGVPYIALLFWFGEARLTVSVEEMKWLIVAAVIGAIIGIGTVVAILEPETD
jgi:hypothetical protein